MVFEEALTQLKLGAKIVRTGWSGAEEYVALVHPEDFEGQTMLPYFVIKVREEGYAMFQPTVCDILADDWAIVASGHELDA